LPAASRLTTIVMIVVEDSDEDFDTVVEAVRKVGIVVEVRRATTGGGCLDLLRGAEAIRPAVVLMDLNTPGTDGREALATIKAESSLKVIPVVVFSTSADPRDMAFCYAAGANAYHVKPVRYLDHLQLVVDLLTYWLGRVAPPNGGGTAS
jgi:CheY-like chemotaxis protein